MTASIIADQLRCAYLVNPLGIDNVQPRFSWTISALQPEQRALRQSAYQLLVASSPETLATNTGDLWDSGKVMSPETIYIIYAGQPLNSGQRYWWKVRVWDNDDAVSPFSEVGWWEMGLLHENDWHAQWIGLPGQESDLVSIADVDREVMKQSPGLTPVPYLRKTLTLAQPVRRARLYVSARGLYEAHINGQRIGDNYFAPGWTDYRKRIQYQTYDVTDQLQAGENVLGLLSGTGWYSGHVGFHQHGGGYHHYGAETRVLLQLHIELVDSSSTIVFSDQSWRGTIGPILYSDFLAGELYDARRELIGWDTPGYVENDWRPVVVEPRDTVPLVAELAEPIRVTQELAPHTIKEVAPGVHIFDMGQNMVGITRLRVQGEAGTRIQLRHAEILNPDGTIYTTNLRSARQTNTYILNGSGEEIFEPHFTFQGFRYVEVTGYPGTPSMSSVIGRVIHSDTPTSGTFECSHPMVNQLQQNIVWGQRGNFLSIPTDCPQRDERLGWMGDAQIFVRTAAYNMDVAAFFTKWLDDVVDAQSEEGGFPDVAPRLVDMADGAPAWGDAGIIVPWTLYQMYGDTHIIECLYGPMKRWIEYIHSANPNLLWTQRLNNNFGDWLSIEADTPKEVLATAYFAYDALLLSRMARALDRQDDAEKYRTLYRNIANAFTRAYVSEDGRIRGETQTVYVLALHMQLLPENLRPLAAQHLVADIQKRGGHLSTGFVGVGYLCPVLTEAGYIDVAYRLLLNDTFPSWGYSIKQGATTIWERWDGCTEEKGFQDPSMNSFNHYSLGSVGQWLYQYVAGIDVNQERPGFRHIIIRPHPGPGLDYAQATYRSIHGPIRSSWRYDNDALIVEVTIPANTTAIVALPFKSGQNVYEGEKIAVQAEGVTFQREEGGRRLFKVGSGMYKFRVA